MRRSAPILVTGATGYVGGRLIPALLQAGWRVRAMGRSLDKLACRPWAHHAGVELATGDVLDRSSLRAATAGCEAVYYLVHSMIAQKGGFVEADRVLGGRGLERVPKPPDERRPGDTLDFWRLLTVEPPRRLRLLSEMKAPGDALLDLTIVPLGENRCELQLMSRFLPRGLAGILYWYGFSPFHHMIFRGMLRGVLRAAASPALRGPERWQPSDKDACFLPPQ